MYLLRKVSQRLSVRSNFRSVTGIPVSYTHLRSRGFGFVEMTSDTDGQKAINELNGAEYDQKTISVSVARPREERSRNNGYNSRRY